MVLRYLDSPHRTREIAARTHPVPELVEISSLVTLELGDADRIDPRRTLISPDLLPRPEDQTFRYCKRLHLLLRLAHRFVPIRVDRRVRQTCPAPSLQHHYSTFVTTTNWPAPVPRFGTL